MADDEIPYWVLLSVLFSSFPLEQKLAMALHHVAMSLHVSGDSEGLIDSDLAHGKVINPRKVAALGSMTGPVFEAELETPRGKGEVRFFLTHQGLELMAAQQRERTGSMLN